VESNQSGGAAGCVGAGHAYGLHRFGRHPQEPFFRRKEGSRARRLTNAAVYYPAGFFFAAFLSPMVCGFDFPGAFAATIAYDCCIKSRS